MSDKTVDIYGKIAVSIVVLVIFIGALIVAFLSKNENMLMILVGVAAGNSTTAVGFWLGSSSSSAKKDDALIAKSNG